MKFKYSIIILLFIVVLFSCKKDDDNRLDPTAQALIDDEKLVDFLQSHYYKPAEINKPFGDIDTILHSETSLMSDDRLNTLNITYKSVAYKLYYLMINEGARNNPTKYDSVFVKFRGFTLDSTRFDEVTSFNTARSWITLTDVVQGWKYGFEKFKGAEEIVNPTPGEPISLENTGKGVLFFPSGLGFADQIRAGIPQNSPIYFHIELGLVVLNTDNDNDGVTNKDEDLDGDGDVVDDDTDGDRIANYLDRDDDGDGKLTKDELGDSNNDGKPDYLDPNIK